jgi:hypothetical protein
MKTQQIIPLLLSTLVLCSCAIYPTGPSQMALPGQGKSYEVFQADDQTCQSYAQNRIGGTSAGQSAAASGAQSAVVGTMVGAAAGALIGGGSGAAIGAGSGLLVGSAAGAGTSRVSAFMAQETYDQVYVQCMYGKGHRVPLPLQGSNGYDAGPYDYPPGPAYYAPPPYYRHY